jgi:hypothetical protein
LPDDRRHDADGGGITDTISRAAALVVLGEPSATEDYRQADDDGE